MSAVIESTDSIATPNSDDSSNSCSSSMEKGVAEEKREEKEDEPSSPNPLEEPEAVFSFEFVPDSDLDTYHSTLGCILRESCIVPRSSRLFLSLQSERTFFLTIDNDDSSPMSWKGLNSLVSVARVEYSHIESLLDRKNVISIFDLPNFDMYGGSEVLSSLERNVQKLSVVEKRETSPIPADPRPAKADQVTVKRALIVTILKGELKTRSEEKMRELANDSCFDTKVKDVQAVIDPLCDEHFFLLFVRPSHILDNIALIRRGLLHDQISVRKVVETTPVVQDRFLELVADPSRCFPVEVKKKEKPEPKSSRGTINSLPLKAHIASNGFATPKAEPSTPPSEDSRRARGPTSGHVARRLVEGSLGIRSTVTREQLKKENALVATFAAEKRATRQKAQAVANQVKEAFE
ncbi:hypothetical protein PRIPAC_97505 [Pristionchus pacificus]|uniref:Uncharacterized protein n=1 Tax=Pristionchus pacificus TaxID=54126 RepID=A0A2A6BJV1_PRIPA|nr:hypothetical protein PRIPAC_97505 [Pristionchus pacificus]|eukprot:PDM66113.1 hypothetical protein PRIPAC_45338 [Pristionchus pacificus]